MSSESPTPTDTPTALLTAYQRACEHVQNGILYDDGRVVGERIAERDRIGAEVLARMAETPAPTDPRGEMIDRAAHAIAQITHPIFQSDDAWEHAIPMFKEHWRRLARAAFAVYNEDVK